MASPRTRGGSRILELAVYEPRLRWPVARGLPRRLAGQRIERIGRRAKYLLLGLDGGGSLLLHLGMSGNLRAVPAATPRLKHDHFDLLLDSGRGAALQRSAPFRQPAVCRR